MIADEAQAVFLKELTARAMAKPSRKEAMSLARKLNAIIDDQMPTSMVIQALAVLLMAFIYEEMPKIPDHNRTTGKS